MRLSLVMSRGRSSYQLGDFFVWGLWALALKQWTVEDMQAWQSGMFSPLMTVMWSSWPETSIHLFLHFQLHDNYGVSFLVLLVNINFVQSLEQLLCCQFRGLGRTNLCKALGEVLWCWCLLLFGVYGLRGMPACSRTVSSLLWSSGFLSFFVVVS